jgi:hypothetical protein
MEPTTAAAIVARLSLSERIVSAREAADDVLVYDDVDTFLAADDARVLARSVSVAWPEMPITRQGIFLIPMELARMEDANNSDIEEFSGSFGIVVHDPRPIRCLLIASAIRRDFNKDNRQWPIPNDFGGIPCQLDRFKITRKGNLIAPSADEGWQVFRSVLTGSIMERLAES